MTETELGQVHQGLNIRIRRTAKGITQDALALLLGTKSQRISEIEQMSVIDDKILGNIAKALDTDVKWFKTYNPLDVKGYVNLSTNNNTSTDTSTQENIQQQHIDTQIINPVDAVIEMMNVAFDRERALLKEIAEKDKKIALLEQEMKFNGKK